MTGAQFILAGMDAAAILAVGCVWRLLHQEIKHNHACIHRVEESVTSGRKEARENRRDIHRKIDDVAKEVAALKGPPA